MPEAHEVYSARQAADRLGLSPAMTRRYGAMLEEVTGEPIKQHARDGRQYRADQIAVMLQAKTYVETNSRLTVSDALKIALGIASEPVAPEIIAAPQIASQQLTEAFSKALEQSLLPELRELRAEVARLRQQIEVPIHKTSGKDLETAHIERRNNDESNYSNRDGLLVRIARGIERWLWP